MDRARATRAIEAINLAATGDSTALQVLMDEARDELDAAGWNETMAPAANTQGIGVPYQPPQGLVTASEPAAEPSAVPAAPPVAEPEPPPVVEPPPEEHRRRGSRGR